MFSVLATCRCLTPSTGLCDPHGLVGCKSRCGANTAGKGSEKMIGQVPCSASVGALVDLRGPQPAVVAVDSVEIKGTSSAWRRTANV
ncbi:hypothetical protein TGDOM2_217722 [Toxoplasma gondii GAB2-2007-GAL-DOM2]|uniref:Uncharacterized protein n=2 Tax=Toxoplasma gondii TaxID=5811 RepID=A0A086L1V7_TOXGO|nr:hypothetical protein TGDOM2_217722 [Toxoplasma gondii GAB2-2007-GAL-DOM2]KFG50625.1 hypothetical protein TGFOU_217722 [Toxoplasma gondii FOU]